MKVATYSDSAQQIDGRALSGSTLNAHGQPQHVFLASDMLSNLNFAQVRSLSNPVAPNLQDPGSGYLREHPGRCLQRVSNQTRKAFSTAREVLDMLLAKQNSSSFCDARLRNSPHSHRHSPDILRGWCLRFAMPGEPLDSSTQEAQNFISPSTDLHLLRSRQ